MTMTEKQQFNIGLSPRSYSLLGQEKERLKSQGQRMTRRELADRAITAAYGGGE